MKMLMINKKAVLGLITLLSCFFNAPSQSKMSPVDYVDPTIGGVGLILEPTRPTIHLPNSMVRVFPFRKDQLDDQISYFPLTISSHRQPALFGLMPYAGVIDKNAWNKKFTYDQEKIAPYYYSVRLEDSDNKIEFTPSARSGYFRFSFKENEPHYLRFSILNDGEINVTGKNVITGTEQLKGMQAYFYAEINTEITAVNYADAATKKQLLAGVGKQQVVGLRYGVSFVSISMEFHL